MDILMSEAAAWITLDSIISAAHYVKNNGADLSGQMGILMPDDDVAQEIFVRVTILVVKNVRCSEVPIHINQQCERQGRFSNHNVDFFHNS